MPLGTMMLDISLRPSAFLPVTAASTTGPVTSVPELLMKILAPLITQLPSTSLARVWIAPASDPAFGSVNAIEPMREPSRMGRRNFSFCASLPKLFNRLATEELAISELATAQSTRASSSSTMTKESQEPPPPP